MKKIIILLISINLLAQNSEKTKIEEIFTIGNDISASRHYFFQRPMEINIDSKNNFYVRDKNSTTIDIFSGNGEFKQTIGRVGKGPGEYIDISCFSIDEEDSIFIYDRGNRRLTTSANYEKILYINNNPLIGELHFLKKFGVRNEFITWSISDSDSILTVYSNKFDKIEYHLFDKKNFSEDDEFYSMYNSGDMLINVFSDSIVYIAPRLYNGFIFKLSRQTGEWDIKKIYGTKPNIPAYESKNENTINFENSKNDKISRLICSFGRKRFYAHIHHMSVGLFSQGKFIIHLFLLSDRNGGDLVADIFRFNGDFIKNIELKRYNKENEGVPLLSLRFLAKDLDDNYYLTQYEDGVPVIKKIKLNIDF